MPVLSLGRGNEAARVHYIIWGRGCIAACRDRATAGQGS